MPFICSFPGCFSLMELYWVGYVRTDLLSDVGVSSVAVQGLGCTGVGDPQCCSAEQDPGAVLAPTQCTAHARAQREVTCKSCCFTDSCFMKACAPVTYTAEIL